MRVVFLVSALSVLALASTGIVEYHLNSMIETFPPHPSLVQIEATLLSHNKTAAVKKTGGIDVRDEIAALMIKMKKDITKEEQLETRNNIAFQNTCDRNHKSNVAKKARYSGLIKKYKQMAADAEDNYKVIPGQVKKLEAAIAQLHVDELTKMRSIKTAQKKRDGNREAYLTSMVDFNKALDDIDKLRLLVAQGLSNRGQGANSQGARFTQSPTSVKVTAPPTPLHFNRKNTHNGSKAGANYTSKVSKTSAGFLQLASSEELSSMDKEEANAAMHSIYENLRKNDNPMIISVVETLDSVLQTKGSTDSIRKLLIQVRNELQKSKRAATQAEVNAISTWKAKKIRMTDSVNDIRISWANTYATKANKWRNYGNVWQRAGQALRKVAIYRRLLDTATINDDFAQVECKTQDDDYKRASDKRNGQIIQISKALGLLTKMGLGGKYGSKVRDTIKDLSVGLCRAYDDHSKWVSIGGGPQMMRANRPGKTMASWDQKWVVYKSNYKKLCISKLKYTYSCTGKCDVRTFDRRLKDPKVSLTKRASFPRILQTGGGQTAEKTFRFEAMPWIRTRNVFFGSGTATQKDVQIYVVPDCNCNANRDSNYDISGKVANTTKSDKVSLPKPTIANKTKATKL